MFVHLFFLSIHSDSRYLAAAEHEEFVRARKRHYAKEGEAMKVC